MKILHVITSLNMGGAEVLVVNLIPRFHAMGHEVGVVVFNGVSTKLSERLEQNCSDCKIYRLGTSYYNPWYIVKLIRIMWQYDIIHTHNSSPQFFAAIANMICHKKLVTTEHSTNNRKREKGGLLRLLDKWMYKQYDKVICISEVAEEKLKGYLEDNPFGNDEEKKQNSKHETQNIITINNGVDVEAIHHAMPINDLKSEKFVVVMVAGFREAKDQDTLIRAMKKLPEEKYELWLVGDGVRRKILESIVEDLELKQQVKFLGVRMDVPNVLKTADVVVMSSHWEGLSLSNIEGMSAGKPFVASDVNGLREVTKGYGILFPHEDADALAAVITRLHDEQSYYQQVADKCYERAKMFDISVMADNYNNIYIGGKY